MGSKHNINKAKVYSIFGQEDQVIAEAMVKEGKATKIDKEKIPQTEMFDKYDREAAFAIILPNRYLTEYEQRVYMLKM